MGEVPLFPLNTVLFPGGELPLRIFEPRYLSMVAERMKHQLPFGVVLISQGQEAGPAASFHKVGTLARIIDFDQLDDGSLGLACKGETRIRVDSHRVMPDQLVIGNVTLVEESVHRFAQGLGDRLDNICRFLRQIRERQGAGSGDYEDSPDHWENPEWVSFQAAEILPLSPENRQLILEMSVGERILEIDHVLSDNQL
jgi:Lon protease-like protein